MGRCPSSPHVGILPRPRPGRRDTRIVALTSIRVLCVTLDWAYFPTEGSRSPRYAFIEVYASSVPCWVDTGLEKIACILDLATLSSKSPGPGISGRVQFQQAQTLIGEGQ